LSILRHAKDARSFLCDKVFGGNPELVEVAEHSLGRLCGSAADHEQVVERLRVGRVRSGGLDGFFECRAETIPSLGVFVDRRRA